MLSNINFTAIHNSDLYKNYSNESNSLKLRSDGYNPLRFLQTTLKALQANISNPSSYIMELDNIFGAFATDNGFSFESIGKGSFGPKDKINISPISLPNKSWNVNFHRAVSGKVENKAFVYGVGMDMKTGTVVTCLQVTLPTTTPPLYAGLLQNDTTMSGNAIEKNRGYEARHLEGNFSKTYAVYAQKEDSLTAHYILSPEVMEKMLSNKIFNLWMEGNSLVIYSTVGSYQVYLENAFDFFSFADMLIKNIDLLKKYL